MRKFLGTFVFIIALFVVIIVIFDYAENVDDFITNKAPFRDIMLDYYANFAPSMINMFCGLFTFVTVIWFTSKLASQTEIVAILSSGVSFRRLMRPYLLSALIITGASLSLSLWVIPNSSSKVVEFQSKYIQRKKREAQKYDPNIYRQIDQNIFVYIRNFSGESNRAKFLAIERYDGTALVEVLDASDVRFIPETKRWSAPKYTIRQYGPEGEQYKLCQKLDTLINLDALELGKVEELIKTMPIEELNDFIAAQKAKGSDQITLFEVERQQRYSYPFSILILTLMGVSLSSQKKRGGTGVNLGVGIVLCFTYIMVAKFAEEFAKGGVLPAQISVWLPNLLFAVIAVYLYKKAPK
ncbi:MAG: LptF/LptG family permease [Rikenellaceae bacterium]|nr:LptF/LptG family permease [Rikenellaceae bacterium]